MVGASAVLDRRDVGPQGIVRAGGEILHFGMPVDPGNLICLGRIGEHPALVLPGCARSPKLNGIDWVLHRLFAGLKVTPADIMKMGVGGLLKEIDVRPLPREKASAQPPHRVAPRSAPTIAAVVLGAGRSRRMAPHNKLLVADKTGKTMIARVVDNVLSSNARPILVVTGHMAEQVEHALGGRPVRYVHAADYAEGLSASLKAGIAAVPPECAAAIVCLGDMPLVTGRMIDRLLAAYDPDEGRLIVLPVFHGKQGNPMLWDRRFFPEILGIIRRFRRPVPDRQAHGIGRRGGDGRRRRAARLRHDGVAGEPAASAAAGGRGVNRRPTITEPGAPCHCEARRAKARPRLTSVPRLVRQGIGFPGSSPGTAALLAMTLVPAIPLG